MSKTSSSYIVIACLSLGCISGCGGKGSTKLSYTAPIAPLGISFSVDKDGTWSVSAGAATPFGTFAIEHSFETRDEFTYIVLRNRERGTDQVWKISNSGYVDVHTVGEHTLRIQRDKNKVIIDVQTVYGTIDVTAYPSNSAIARIDFGKESPDLVLTTNRELIAEDASMFTANTKIPLDSVASITLEERVILPGKWLCVEWKKGINDKPLEIDLSKSTDTDVNYASLEKNVHIICPHVAFQRSKLFLVSCFLLILYVVIGFFVFVLGFVAAEDNPGGLVLGTFGYFILLAFVGMIVRCAGLDWAQPALSVAAVGFLIGVGAGIVKQKVA